MTNLNQNKTNKEKVGVRINKYLALKNITTRKGADELIKNKKVFINGKLAILGNKVNEGDKVEVKENKNKKIYRYFAYNKPRGLATPDISLEGIFPIGRLDKDSHGLLILTNDGRITDKLLNPKYVHEKEYLVKTGNKLRSSFKQKMEIGVQIEDSKTKPCKVQILNENIFKIILTEGKKHQIRRMCSALFQEVADLKRSRILNIELGNLKPGTSREIKGKELEIFLAQVLN
jgi:23S rRNA pseudouridine2604 synthase